MLNPDALSQLKQLKQDIKASRNLATGEVKGTMNKFGFVALDSGKDIFLPPDEMLKVFPGDRVEIEIKKGEKNKDVAVIERLLKSRLKEFVGRYIVRNKAQFVEPLVSGLNRWIYIPPKKRKQAADGDYIRCRVIQHALKNGKPQAEVLNVVGNESAPGIEVNVISTKYGLREDWPESAVHELQNISQDNIDALKTQREDLSNLNFITIDSIYSQDLDDAICVTEEEDGWLLNVAIADPSALIPADSALESECLKRASSVYFPGKQIAMLPRELSSDLCSLLPEQNRAALVCQMKIGSDGTISQFDFKEAIIQSKRKMNYTEVDQILDGCHSDTTDLPETIAALLPILKKVYQARLDWRNSHACPPQEQKEFDIVLDDKKKIASIHLRPRSIARKIVEECMIATNSCIAQFLSDHNVKSLYISHAGVRPDRMANISTLLTSEDSLATVDIESLPDFAQLMRYAAKNSSIQSVISRQLDRSRITRDPGPHFGMGLPCYTTATSPIRKAVDFLVQKQLKAVIKGEKSTPLDEAKIESLSEHLQNIRQAMNEVERWLKCEFIQRQESREFDAEVIRCSSVGFHIRTLEQGLEGFVSTRDMKQKFSFDAIRLSLKSKTTKIELDQQVRVSFKNIDWKNQQIQFNLIEEVDSGEQRTP